MEKLWNDILICLKERLSEPNYQIFINSASPISYTDGIFLLKVDNPFSKGWVSERCIPLIQQFFKNTGFEQIVFEFKIEDPVTEPDQIHLFSETAKEKEVGTPSRLFNPHLTFDSFVVGNNNRFAYAAAQAVAKNPFKAYNPFFIYGSVGLGKTHLLHAISNDIQAHYPHLKICMATSEKFTNDLISSLKNKTTNTFKDKYRTVDVLLIDDIQFLAGKETTQEEFFHTFNELHENQKQIILTSDRPPKDIPTLQDRLRTRFGWGLIADIQPPELETRIAILGKKSEAGGMQVPDEILHFIATQIPSNVREMEGALTRIVAYASLLNTEVTLSIASNVIKDMIGIKQEKPITITAIKRVVSEYFNIEYDNLSVKNRTKEISYARQMAMYLARELTNISLPNIGKNFGNRDHSTVLHACDKVKQLIESDPETKNILTVLITTIKQSG